MEFEITNKDTSYYLTVKVQDESAEQLLKSIQRYWHTQAVPANGKILIWMSIQATKPNQKMNRIPIQLSMFPKLEMLLMSSHFLNFTAVDSVNAKQLKGLGLSDSKQMLKLSTGTFYPMDKLEWLHIVNNQLESIDDFAFKNLTTLQELHLNENKLTKIGRNTFGGLVGLKRLVLAQNQIHTIDAGAFTDLKKLDELGLSDNKLKVINDGTLEGPTTLSLCLGGNQIESVGNYLYNLATLKELWLDSNPINDIDFVKFSKLPNLKQLGLRKTGLADQHINSEESSDSPLEGLDLSENNLKSASSLKILRVFTHLKALNLTGNKELEEVNLQKLRSFLPALQNLTLH